MLEVWSEQKGQMIQDRIVNLDKKEYRVWTRYYRSQAHRVPLRRGSRIRTVAAQIQLEYLGVLDALELVAS